MILLLGGTSDTAPIARGLAAAGLPVMVSTATDIHLDVGVHPLVTRRSGRLDAAGLVALCRKIRARLIIDATHPYAVEISRAVRSAAEISHIPLLCFERPPAAESEPEEHPDFFGADDHEQAAQIAFSFGKPVLVTIGSRHLAAYVRASRQTGLELSARILNDPASRDEALRQGLNGIGLITGRGPFSLEQNLDHIRESRAGVMVTKDGGISGGFPAKLQAARMTGCQLVVVTRPESACPNVYRDYDALVAAAAAAMNTIHKKGTAS